MPNRSQILSAEQFTVVRFVADALVGEPTKSPRILERARDAFRGTATYRAYLEALEALEAAVGDADLDAAVQKLTARAPGVTARQRITPRYLAGIALRASLESVPKSKEMRLAMSAPPARRRKKAHTVSPNGVP